MLNATQGVIRLLSEGSPRSQGDALLSKTGKINRPSSSMCFGRQGGTSVSVWTESLSGRTVNAAQFMLTSSDTNLIIRFDKVYNYYTAQTSQVTSDIYVSCRLHIPCIIPSPTSPADSIACSACIISGLTSCAS